jgi:serine/threonine protein kinase
VTVAPGTLPRDGRTFAPAVLARLPQFPPGDWNTGHVGLDSTYGSDEPIFISTEKADLPGVKTIWHPTSIDCLQPRKLARLRQNIHIVSHPLFSDPVVIKFTEFPWQTPYFESETAAYQWIDGCDIGPRFLGHLTEEGRVFGFVLEYIDNARAVGPADLDACQGVLKRLHALGIKHGDINKHNFMMREDGRCVTSRL